MLTFARYISTRILILLLLLGIRHTVQAQCQSIQLADSSFESQVFDFSGLNGWLPNDGCDFTQTAYHGTYSVCSNAGGAGQYVRVEPQTTYYLSCYILNPSAYPYWFGAGTTSLYDSTDADTWTFISLEFFTGADTSVFVSYYTNGNACVDLMRVTCDPLSSLDLSAPEIDLRIFPNPASNFLTLRFDKPLSKGRATLTNSLGQVVRSQGIGYASQVIWDISDLPVGVYFVRVWRDGQAVVRKVARI